MFSDINPIYFIPLGICVALLAEQLRRLRPNFCWLRPEWFAGLMTYAVVMTIFVYDGFNIESLWASVYLLLMVLFCLQLRFDTNKLRKTGLRAGSMLILAIASFVCFRCYHVGNLYSVSVPLGLSALALVIPFVKRLSMRIVDTVAVMLIWVSWLLIAQLMSSGLFHGQAWMVFYNFLYAIGVASFVSWALGRYLEAVYLRENIYQPLSRQYQRLLEESHGQQHRQLCRQFSAKCDRCQSLTCGLVADFTDQLLEEAYHSSVDMRTTIHRMDEEMKNLRRYELDLSLSSLNQEVSVLKGLKLLRGARKKFVIARSLRAIIETEIDKAVFFLHHRNSSLHQKRLEFIHKQIRVVARQQADKKQGDSSLKMIRRTVKYLLECEKLIPRSMLGEADYENFEALQQIISEHPALFNFD